MSIFSVRIKEIRGSLSYKQFENKTGIPAATLERLEKIGADIKSGQIVKICITCGVTADWLLGIDGGKTSHITAHNGSIAIGGHAYNNNINNKDCSSCPFVLAAAKMAGKQPKKRKS